MKDATLAQGNQVLNLILQKQVPADQLQDLLESGLLSDLLFANLRGVKRDEFRRLIGLQPLTPTFVLTLDPANPFVRDMTKEGWTLESDVEYQPGEVELELAEFLKPGEGRITGYEMAERAKKMCACLGQKQAEVFLANYERWFPAEGVFFITFPGTIWQGPDNRRFVPYLYWRSFGGRWRLGFYCLGRDWGSHDRLLRPCPSTSV